MPLDDHGHIHLTQYDVNRANERYKLEALEAQKEVAKNAKLATELTSIQASIALSQANNAARQTELLQDKLELERNIAFLENESAEAKWNFIYSKIELELITKTEEAAKRKIKSTWLLDNSPRRTGIWAQNDESLSAMRNGLNVLIRGKTQRLDAMQCSVLKFLYKAKIETLRKELEKHEADLAEIDPKPIPPDHHTAEILSKKQSWILTDSECEAIFTKILGDFQKTIPARCRLEANEIPKIEVQKRIVRDISSFFRVAPLSFLKSI